MSTDLAQWLFDPSGMTPHGFCLLWQPGLIWLYAASDIGIGVAYFTIPVILGLIAYRRGDLIFRPVFWLFAAFILLCGTTHWLDVLTLWVPAYGIEGVVKAATAIVSLITAATLVRLLPHALALPSPAQMRQTEAALRDSETRYRASFEQSPVPLYTLNGHDVITGASQSLLTLLGYEAGQVVGHPIYAFRPNGASPTTEQDRARLKDAGEIRDIPREFARRDGSVVQALVSARIEHSDDPARTNVICVLIDITDRMRAEADLRTSQDRLHQSQKMEAVGQLTGGIAHDFNNMLQGIAGGLHLMERRLQQGRIDDALTFFTATRHALNSAAGLTDRLLAFSRRQTLQPRPTEVNLLIRDMDELIRRTVGSGVFTELDLAAGGMWVLCDPNQLESALLNLAINSRDAMPAGGTLSLSTRERYLVAGDLPGDTSARAGRFIEIVVSDTGVGMTNDVQERVFEPFFTTKAAGYGTGLGLSQMHGFVHQSGGLVELTSAPGYGTTIRLVLPRVERPALPAAVARTGDALPADPQDVTGRVVLVVEDQAGVRAQIVDALQEIGCTVIEAKDGVAGADILRSSAEIGLLVADVGLPRLNGREMAEIGRRTRAELPVIFVTGFAGTALDDMPLEAGMEVLRKPFGLDQLVWRARQLLGGP